MKLTIQGGIKIIIKRAVILLLTRCFRADPLFMIYTSMVGYYYTPTSLAIITDNVLKVPVNDQTQYLVKY